MKSVVYHFVENFLHFLKHIFNNFCLYEALQPQQATSAMQIFFHQRTKT